MEPPREAVFELWSLLGFRYEHGTAVGLSRSRGGRRLERVWLLSLRVREGVGGEQLGDDGEDSRLHGVLHGCGRR